MPHASASHPTIPEVTDDAPSLPTVRAGRRIGFLGRPWVRGCTRRYSGCDSPPCRDADGPGRHGTRKAVAAFVVLNVFIGIVLNSMEEARELERRNRLAPDGDALFGVAPAPVAERIQHLRAAVDELEQELAAANGGSPCRERPATAREP